MLVPAILFKDKLNELLVSTWYNPEYMYFWSESYCTFDFETNDYWKRQFAFIDSNGEVTGYFSYCLNRSISRAYDFGFISFKKPNYIFAKEVIRHLQEQFDLGVFKSMEFYCYADNPAVRGYEKLIERFGGVKIGTSHQCVKLMDGKIHDNNMYEIIRK